MLNFEYFNPVRIVFGRDSVGKIAELLPDIRIMMLYGGGSIRRNGVYDQVKNALANFKVIEFGGIEANPEYSTCMKAAKIARNENAGFLLAVGGGSVLDAAKFIAAATCYRGQDPWDILTKDVEITGALPLGAVITLPATGSEMNSNSVISRAETREKFHFSSPMVFPRFSIIDPSTTYSLPERQTVNGIVDTFVHVCEQYMTFNVNSPLQDRLSEGILRTLVDNAMPVLENPDDYDTRANLFWCSTLGLNGLIGAGVMQDWATHMIGHELTALYGLDHAQTLAIVMPALWRHCKERKLDKLRQYAREVWNIDCAKVECAADAAINQTEAFFHSISMRTRLADYGIDPREAAEEIRERFSKRQARFGENGDIDADAAHAILLTC